MGEDADLEIEAMAAVSRALSGLNDEERGRVIRWATERYGVTVGKAPTRRLGKHPEDEDTGDGDEEEEVETGGEGGDGWEHFADLYDAVGPTTNPNRLLVAAYWTQYVESKTTFGSLELNKLLKDLGHGVTNTAHVMGSLMSQKPALILQVKKSGKTRQARKTYKVTGAGKKAVEQMIAANGS